MAADAFGYTTSDMDYPAVITHCSYANNQITNTYAQPGRAHGVFPPDIDCADYQNAATADALAMAAGFANQLNRGEVFTWRW